MTFKNYFIASVDQKLEKLNDLYEPLFEAAEEFYNMTSDGIKQLYDLSFTDPPKATKATNFILLNPKNEEDKKRITAYKKSKGTVRAVAYTLPKSRIIKPSTDSHFFNVSKEFRTFKELVATTPEEKALVAKIREREDERKKVVQKTSADIYFKLTDDEIVTFLDILRNTDPTKFARGVYYFLDKDNDLFFEYIYNKKDPKFDFNKLFKVSEPYQGHDEENGGFKISGKAKELEDVQVLGLYFDAQELSDAIAKFAIANPDLKKPYESKEFKNIVRPFEVALESSDEFRSFNGVIKRDYKNFSYNDWDGVCQLANGMTQFRKNVVKITRPYIIFSNVDKFKELETEKMGYREGEQYGKVSTVDVIISTIPGNDLMKIVSNKDSKLVGADQAVNVVVDGKVVAKFWQISLKESIETSQLGRSQKYFSKVYKMNVDAKNVFDSYQPYENLLSESVLEKLSDTAKKGAKFLKQIGKKFFDKIKYLFLALREWSSEIRTKITRQVSDRIVDDARALYGQAITESVKEDINNLIIKLLMVADKNWEMANEKINMLGTDLTRMKNALVSVSYSNVEKPPKIVESVFKKQIFVNSFMKAFKNVIENSKNPLEKYIEELLGLYVEAVFGATELPLWKVYSTFGGHVPYEYAGTKESAKEFRKGNILKNLGKDGMPLVSLIIEPKKGSHNISMFLLTNLINEEGKFSPYYTEFSIDYDKNTLAPQFIAERENVVLTKDI